MTGTPRPNILWICTDQQRFDTLGCYGNVHVLTPHLDALAAGGARFEHAYCQTPICTPSRVSFLTGRYPSTTRIRQNGQSVSRHERLVTRMLADGGYHCGLVGKLHVAPGHPSVAADGEKRVDDGYRDFHWSRCGEKHHSLTTGRLERYPNAYFQWARERGCPEDVLERHAHPRSECLIEGVRPEYQHSAWCAEVAREFIRSRRDDDGPWLFSMNLFDPHHPFDAAPQYLDRYNLDSVPLPNFVPGELDSKPSYQMLDHQRGAYAGRAGNGAGRTGCFAYPQMSDLDHRLVRASYWASIDFVDTQIGLVLETLRETGQEENTLVVIMSDHGEMLGDHGIYLKGPFFYDPLVRVPLIMSWPDHIAAGRVIPDLVELVDVAPTVLEAAGLGPAPGAQGRSLLPWLVGESRGRDGRTDVLCQYYNALAWHWEPAPFATMIRTANHKLVRVHSHDTGELYDLVDDPGETVNRWDDPGYSRVRVRLLERLADRMAFACDPLPPREAPW